MKLIDTLNTVMAIGFPSLCGMPKSGVLYTRPQTVANKLNRGYKVPYSQPRYYTAISIKVVSEQSGKVEYERERLAGNR
jgi:hypothetical protein